MIALILGIAPWTAEKQVFPFVGEPVVTWALHSLLDALLASGFGAEVFDMSVLELFGFTETALTMLGED
jgi:hypothetical protein